MFYCPACHFRNKSIQSIVKTQKVMKFRRGIKRVGGTQTLSDIFPEVVKEYKLEQAFTIESLALKWNEIVGEIIGTHSMPDRLFKGILFISVDHPVYSNEIMLMKNLIIRNIEEKFCRGVVKSIKTEVKNLNW